MPRQFGKRDASVGWPRCDRCPHRHEPGSACPPFRAPPGDRATAGDAIWLIAPMPAGQWPVDKNRPRDDSFSWWVRSHCGHEGGARQWAFYNRRYAVMYRQVFLDDPCRYTRCHDQKRDEDGS